MREVSKQTDVLTYWDCGRDNCKTHHRTKESAIKCHEVGLRSLPNNPNYKKVREKYIMCAMRRKAGETYSSIAKDIGSSPTYVRQMVQKGNMILTKRAKMKV